MPNRGPVSNILHFFPNLQTTKTRKQNGHQTGYPQTAPYNHLLLPHFAPITSPITTSTSPNISQTSPKPRKHPQKPRKRPQNQPKTHPPKPAERNRSPKNLPAFQTGNNGLSETLPKETDDETKVTLVLPCDKAKLRRLDEADEAPEHSLRRRGLEQ